MRFEKRSRVRGLVIQWEGISTQCICGTPQEPFEISVFWFKIVYLIKMIRLAKRWVWTRFLKIRRPNVEVLT